MAFFFLIIIKCIFIVLLAMYAVSYVRRLPIMQFHWWVNGKD